MSVAPPANLYVETMTSIIFNKDSEHYRHNFSHCCVKVNQERIALGEVGIEIANNIFVEGFVISWKLPKLCAVVCLRYFIGNGTHTIIPRHATGWTPKVCGQSNVVLSQEKKFKGKLCSFMTKKRSEGHMQTAAITVNSLRIEAYFGPLS
ncbi:hypothetical protein ECG_02530 [Echinococcus granulosus]|uniref:Vanin_C domain-containing protein n=1 Tax=Echinococcus granulosus TaxID=6210 RepID=A0A068WN27_ECHGR|nr:hypothetical protein ECG_02530 [Echinococcus granulosus]CDS21528.1 hypothetical protein EgrG_000101400 [Echinococcus granulosus]